MRKEIITSRKNPLLQHVRKLFSSRTYREKCAEFAADGVKLLEEAVKWSPEILRTVIVTARAELCPLPEHVRLVEVPEDIMAQVSPMETRYFKEYSPALGRDMECKVYGHAGRPVLFIPCQDGRFMDFEGFHMDEIWAPWIDAGKVMVFSIDTMDKESWSDQNGDPYWRIRRHEQWVHYIVDEMVPFIRAMANERNGWEGAPGIITF